MKWRVRKPRAHHRALKQWHEFFPLIPVRVPTKGRMSGMTLVWFETIMRKGTYECGYSGCYWSWEYKFKGA